MGNVGKKDYKKAKTSQRSDVKLNGRKEERDGAKDLDRIEGRNSVLEAIKAGRTINKILVPKGEKEGSIRQIIALARKGHSSQETDRSNLDKISTTHAHQGVIAYVAFKDYVEVDDILKIAQDKGEESLYYNFGRHYRCVQSGVHIRTADAVGAHGLSYRKGGQ